MTSARLGLEGATGLQAKKCMKTAEDIEVVEEVMDVFVDVAESRDDVFGVTDVAAAVTCIFTDVNLGGRCIDTTCCRRRATGIAIPE